MRNCHCHTSGAESLTCRKGTPFTCNQVADNRLAFVASFPYNSTDFQTIAKRLTGLLVVRIATCHGRLNIVRCGGG